MMPCRLVGTKPLSEPMMVSSLTHISVTHSMYNWLYIMFSDGIFRNTYNFMVTWAPVSLLSYARAICHALFQPYISLIFVYHVFYELHLCWSIHSLWQFPAARKKISPMMRSNMCLSLGKLQFVILMVIFSLFGTQFHLVPITNPVMF